VFVIRVENKSLFCPASDREKNPRPAAIRSASDFFPDPRLGRKGPVFNPYNEIIINNNNNIEKIEIFTHYLTLFKTIKHLFIISETSPNG